MVNFLMSGRGRPRNINEQTKRIAAETAVAEKAAAEQAVAEKAASEQAVAEKAAAEQVAAEKAAAENNEEHIKIEPVE